MASSSSRLTCTTWVSMTACLPPGPQAVARGALPDGRPGDRGEGTVLTSAQQDVVLVQQARSESVALAGEPRCRRLAAVPRCAGGLEQPPSITADRSPSTTQNEGVSPTVTSTSPSSMTTSDHSVPRYQ